MNGRKQILTKQENNPGTFYHRYIIEYTIILRRTPHFNDFQERPRDHTMVIENHYTEARAPLIQTTTTTTTTEY